MITAILLALVGLLFVFLEFYIPGAVMGTIGATLMVVSIFIFGEEADSWVLTLFYTIGLLIALGILIRYTLRQIPKSKSKYSIYLNSDQEGFRASQCDMTLIGRAGEVISDLKPGGYILIDGKRLQAISQSGYIAQGATVQVIGGQEDNLIVIKEEDVP